jgi:hypothetical protein
MRTALTIAVALALLSLGLVAAPAPSHASSVPAPTADIPIVGGLFSGDENEPDENEPDEGSPPARSTAGPGSSSLSPLLAAGLAIVATIFAARWYFRARAWIRQLGRGGPAA